MAEKIFGIGAGAGSSESIFSTKYTGSRTHHPRIRNLIGMTKQKTENSVAEYLNYPPILFDSEDPDNVSGMFLHPALLKVNIPSLFLYFLHGMLT